MKHSFQRKDVLLNVSRFDAEGWWTGNFNEHVVKGTALGNEFTETIYVPSKEGMIGRYDKENDVWTEFKNNALLEFWDESGKGYVVGKPNGERPENAIIDPPPEYDKSKQTVLYRDGKWAVYPILLGKFYWDSDANPFTVSELNFELPSNCTWKKPPSPHSAHHAVRLDSGDWVQVENYIGKQVYSKQDKSALTVTELGPVPNGYTLDEPTEVQRWLNGKWVTQLDLVVKKAHSLISLWRDAQELSPVSTVEVNGVLWNSDPNSRKRIESDLLSNYAPSYWTDANNIDQTPFTLDMLKAIHQAILKQGFKIHDRQRVMKKEVSEIASTTSDDADAIQKIEAYPIGW